MKPHAAPRWLLPAAVVFQLISFLIFWKVTLLADPQALKSSIYTYYQTRYYVHLSEGRLPWIHFNVEYPPLAVFCLLFPAYAGGLSVLTVSLMRASVSAVLTSLVLAKVVQSNTIERQVKIAIVGLTSLLACLSPGFYHGLFDWTMYLAHLLLALSLISVNRTYLTSKATWWLVWFGASIKLLPLLAAPFLAIGLGKEKLKSALLPMSVVAAIHLPFFIFGFEGFRYFVAFHRMRGIDCFSIYSTALLTLENLGLASVSGKDQFGALEMSGPMSAVFAKLSLPLFLVVLVALWLRARKLPTVNQRLGLYFVAILLYPVISKVSQSNYVVWSVSAIVALWILGFTSKRFFNASAVAGACLILIGWFQNGQYDQYLASQTSWLVIIVAWLRFVVLSGVAYIALKEISSTPTLNEIPSEAERFQVQTG